MRYSYANGHLSVSLPSTKISLSWQIVIKIHLEHYQMGEVCIRFLGSLDWNSGCHGNIKLT